MNDVQHNVSVMAIINLTDGSFYSGSRTLPAETYQLEIDRIIRLTDRRAAVLDAEFAK